jgi:hypothetical protein
MSKDKKGVYSGIIEKDNDNNYFCGEYLLDFRMVEEKFVLGDKITIKSVIENPSDKSYDKYPKKSKDFFLFNNKK